MCVDKKPSTRVVLNGEVSDWQHVISGVPQGSVLGPTLSLIHVNDLESNLQSKIAKFADDTKLGGKIICTEDCDKIQKDLYKLKVHRYNTIAHKSYFNVRVIGHRNRLPASVISSKTIDSLNSRLDKYFRETGYVLF